MDYTVHEILQARIPIGVGRLFLLQGIFPTQGSNPSLPHCRWILYQLSYQGSPVINSKFVQIPSHKKQNLTKQTNVIVCDPLENWKRAFFQVWDNWDMLTFKISLPTPVLLPGKSHGRMLVGYSPWGVWHDWANSLHFTSHLKRRYIRKTYLEYRTKCITCACFRYAS